MVGLGKGERKKVEGMAGEWNRFKGRSDDNWQECMQPSCRGS